MTPPADNLPSRTPPADDTPAFATQYDGSAPGTGDQPVNPQLGQQADAALASETQQMSNESLQQLMANRHNMGTKGDTTSDQVLKEEVVRRLLYTESGALSVGEQLVGTENMNQLGVDFEYPGETTAKHPIANDTLVDRQRITWERFSMRLRRGQTRFFMSDGAKLEGMAEMHLDRMRRRSSEALARRKDENILGRLYNGAWSENRDDMAGEHWDDDGTDMIDELFEMWKELQIATPVSDLETSSYAVVLPAEIYIEMHKLELINDIQQQLKDAIGQMFDFTFYGTKLGFHPDDQAYDKYDYKAQDTAMMLIPGSDTALHGVLSPEAASSAGVPLAESERVYGAGEDYYVTQWFETGIMEHESSNEGETPRISVRTGVNSNGDEYYE
jgi:hypothetical protein